MPIIFVVVLRISTGLGYEFDECTARVDFESAVEMSNQFDEQYIKNYLNYLSEKINNYNIIPAHPPKLNKDFLN
jgi:hypothetical protein